MVNNKLIGAPANFNLWGERRHRSPFHLAERYGPLRADCRTRSVVRLRNACLDHHRRVAALVELGFVADGPHHIARTQPECRSQRRQCRDEHGDDDFDDLLFGHSFFSFGARRDSAELVFNFECKDSAVVNNVYHRNGNFCKNSYFPRLLAS